ncbi:hypothetical protein BDV96DRAFT_268963 [Lophiotrema nucula]|uniref:Uncharacterized protein n=1 Tax=Lophiotrema nucula TaxID=690887 RepID=A0A6A5ZNS5_9PLEO|nr:hypothetical protein BDV96DRAFT_268963 [Lophiotrema nucula]
MGKGGSDGSGPGRAVTVPDSRRPWALINLRCHGAIPERQRTAASLCRGGETYKLDLELGEIEAKACASLVAAGSESGVWPSEPCVAMALRHNRRRSGPESAGENDPPRSRMPAAKRRTWVLRSDMGRAGRYTLPGPGLQTGASASALCLFCGVIERTGR